MAGANAEPSMEDILSSIKRIIAEDSEAALSSPRVKRSAGLTPMTPADEEPTQIDDDEEPDVLELTDAVDEAPEVVAEPAPEAAFKPVPLVKPEGESVATAKPASAEPPKKPVLASSQTIQSSKASLAALSALVIKPEITGTDTLEGMVREMIRPMLAEWIDGRLPDIVDRMVAEEIARITSRG
jgi:cell pole-organizing protein PopZ